MASVISPRKPPPAGRKGANASWRFMDVVLIGSVIAISCLGVLMIYSATRRRLALAGLNEFTIAGRQIVFIAIGIGLMAVVASIDYQNVRGFLHIAYVGIIGILVL